MSELPTDHRRSVLRPCRARARAAMDSRREQEARNEAGIRDRNEWIQRTNAQMVANGAGLDSPAGRIVRETEPGRGLPQ